jgi:hypothetical protein
MLDDARRVMAGITTTLGASRASLQATARSRWGRVSHDERLRLRNHGIAIAAAAAAALLSVSAGIQAAGPLLAIDLVVAATAWFAGFPAGAAAALTAGLVVRLAAVPLTGVPFGFALAGPTLVKWLIVAAAAAVLAARTREDARQIAGLSDRIQSLYADAREKQQALTHMESASADANARLRDDANLAREQLTALQSVTDPALNALGGVDLVGALLERLRVAVAADGVAVYQHHGLRGRVFHASGGVEPGAHLVRRPSSSGYQSGRTTLIHNDADRVAETSLCQWPPDVASLILVPVVYSGRLQLVVEVASRRARRSTEWELALIQVVAERAAGLLRPDATFDTGAVA